MTKQPPVSDLDADGLTPSGSLRDAPADTVAGLLALGLDVHSAAVLGFVLRHEEVTATQIVAATGLSPSQVSAAVNGMKKLGLLDRVENRRPALMFVSPHAADVVSRLAAAAAIVHERAASDADSAADRLHEAVARSAARGRPVYEVVPVSDVRQSGFDPYRPGATRHDEVLRGSARTLLHWRPSHRCPTRLLVAEANDDTVRALRNRLERSRLYAEVVVQVTDAQLPELLLLDDALVRLTAGSSLGRVYAWSREGSHLCAAQELFTAWWQAARPAFQLDAFQAPAFDESELEVDEWDENEVA